MSSILDQIYAKAKENPQKVAFPEEIRSVEDLRLRLFKSLFK